MGNVLVNETALQNIANSIRAKNGTETAYKPSEMGEAILNLPEGDDFYDAFWDGFQLNGTRTDYTNAFQLNYWTTENFKPKHDIIPLKAERMFYESAIACDLIETLKELGVRLDTSKITSSYNLMFNKSKFTTLPTISFEGVAVNANLSRSISEMPNCITIEKIITRKDISYGYSFYGFSKLENITFEGEIGTSISFSSSSLLSDASIQSIIDHLADLTEATAQTLTFHKDVKEKLTTEQITAITSKNWTLA